MRALDAARDSIALSGHDEDGDGVDHAIDLGVRGAQTFTNPSVEITR